MEQARGKPSALVFLAAMAKPPIDRTIQLDSLSDEAVADLLTPADAEVSEVPESLPPPPTAPPPLPRKRRSPLVYVAFVAVVFGMGGLAAGVGWWLNQRSAAPVVAQPPQQHDVVQIGEIVVGPPAQH